MKVNNIKNISFKAIYYEGYYKGEKYCGGKERVHFEIKNERPDVYLTDKQQRVTKAVEAIIRNAEGPWFYPDGKKGDFDIYLTHALAEKKTDIYFSYPNPNTVETSIVKWGIGDYGDEYCYNPYNKSGNKRIKMTFPLYIMPSNKSIRKKTDKFVSDCQAFLSDDDNAKNKQVEAEIAAKC